MSEPVLRTAYRGDSYAFSMTFPDSSYLVGAPGNVLAQIRTNVDSDVVLAEWEPTVLGAVLTLTLDEVELDPGTYRTDVQVGSVTYLRNTPFIVEADVSRPA